jgi:hypothetical protein
MALPKGVVSAYLIRLGPCFSFESCSGPKTTHYLENAEAGRRRREAADGGREGVRTPLLNLVRSL